MAQLALMFRFWDFICYECCCFYCATSHRVVKKADCKQQQNAKCQFYASSVPVLCKQDFRQRWYFSRKSMDLKVSICSSPFCAIFTIIKAVYIFSMCTDLQALKKVGSRYGSSSWCCWAACRLAICNSVCMTCSSACVCITLYLNLVGGCWLSCQCCADGDGVCASMWQITRLAQWCTCIVSFQTRWTHTFDAIQLTIDVTADVCMSEIGMLHARMLSLVVALESNDSDLARLAQQEIAQDLHSYSNQL